MDGGFKIFIMNIDNNFIRKFKTSFSQNVNLSNYSWFNLGGNAEYFFKPTDKSQLIEWSQKTKYPVEFSSFSSDENTSFFTYEVVLEDQVIGKGHGNSKKEAEQNAAREALLSLDELNEP